MKDYHVNDIDLDKLHKNGQLIKDLAESIKEHADLPFEELNTVHKNIKVDNIKLTSRWTCLSKKKHPDIVMSGSVKHRLYKREDNFIIAEMCTKDEEFVMHKHIHKNYKECIIVTKGKIVYPLKSLILKSGDIFTIRKHKIHGFEMAPDSCCFIFWYKPL